MIGFNLGNRCQCSKTFGRPCLKIFSKTAICDIKTLSYPRVFDGAHLTAAKENSKFLFFTQLKGGEGVGTLNDCYSRYTSIFICYKKTFY